MQVLVKNLNGQTITKEFRPHDTIGMVKAKLYDDDRVKAEIQNIDGITADQLRVIFGGKQLEDAPRSLKRSPKSLKDGVGVMAHALEYVYVCAHAHMPKPVYSHASTCARMYDVGRLSEVIGRW